MDTFIKLPARVWLAAALLGGLLLSGCGAIDTSGSSALPPTGAPTNIPTAVPTGVPQPTGMPQPTAASTAAPTAVPAPEPTAVPASDGVLPAPLYFVTNSPTENSHIVRLEHDGKTRTNIVDESRAPGMLILEFDVSPVDGSLVYLVQGANGNSLIQTDPAGKHRTVLLADASINTPRWSPDGKTIAFAIFQAEATGGMAGGVYLIPAGGGTPKLLQADDPIVDPNNPDPAARGYTPQDWSPDGTRLLLGTYSRAAELCGTAVKNLATGALVDIDAPERLEACSGVWSLDGSAIYSDMIQPGYMAPIPGLWRADAATGKTTPYIAGEPAQGQFTLVRSVHPLDDGSVYAFLATTDKLPDPGADPNVVWPRFALVRASSDGSDIQKLIDTTYENSGALWAADGSGMLIDQYDAKTNATMLLWLPADGGEPAVIAQDISASVARWGSR